MKKWFPALVGDWASPWKTHPDWKPPGASPAPTGLRISQSPSVKRRTKSTFKKSIFLYIYILFKSLNGKRAKSTDSDQTPSKCIMHHNSEKQSLFLGTSRSENNLQQFLFSTLSSFNVAKRGSEGACWCVCVRACVRPCASCKSRVWQVARLCKVSASHYQVRPHSRTPSPDAGAPVECLIFAAVLVGSFFRNESLSGTWASSDSNSASLIGPWMSVWKWCPTPERTRGPFPAIFNPPLACFNNYPVTHAGRWAKQVEQMKNCRAVGAAKVWLRTWSTLRLVYASASVWRCNHSVEAQPYRDAALWRAPPKNPDDTSHLHRLQKSLH